MVRSVRQETAVQGRGRSSGWSVWGRAGGVALVLALASACGGAYEARFSSPTCSEGEVLEGVRFLRFRVTGPDLAPVERYVPVAEGAAGAPEVPAGVRRVLEVRGYTELPGLGGRVVALGRSRPFDVSLGQGRTVVPVALRRVGEFQWAGTGKGPEACASLADPRAAHTATLLGDGRVLLAGGFQVDLNGEVTTLGSVEVFDPMTGRLEPGPELGPRAFHTATPLPGGRVLLAGGERESAQGPRAVSEAQVLDVVRGTSVQVAMRAARSRHAAGADAWGRVLLVGGVGPEGTVVSEAEGFDSETGQVFAVPTPVGREGMQVAALPGGRQLAVVGGSDGTELRPEVLMFAYEGGTFVPVPSSARLREPRRGAALVPFGVGGRLLVLGGIGSPGGLDSTWLLASSEFVSQEGVTEGPQVAARSELCAVALPDGRVLTAGGLRAEASALVSDARAELLVPGQEGRAHAVFGLKPLGRARYLHTCTTLPDGAVLIAGGRDLEGQGGATLGDLRVFMPPPVD